MTLQEIIRRITEAENSLSKELEKDNLELAQDYLDYTQSLLKELLKLKPSFTEEEKITAKEFAEAYAEHIKEQVKVLAVESAKTKDAFKKVKNKHRISNSYAKIKKLS